MNILKLLGRSKPLFNDDLLDFEKILYQTVSSSTFLVLGGAGSIGQAVTKEIFKRDPKKLHVVDISENNLVELIRDIRSSYGYINGDFQTLALDIGSIEYDSFIKSDGKYDFVLNLSALKHVRSEKDPFTLMRLINTNILNTIKTVRQSIENKSLKYFAVSTDKAANPVNMMGASKRIMELFLMMEGDKISISTARFANVAFSDGSLLHGFNERINKRQPIVAPNDVKRYFVTQEEGGLLCLFSCIFGVNNDVFFPKLDDELHLIKFSTIAQEYLKQKGCQPMICNTEDEARGIANNGFDNNYWPCYFSKSDTTGEKDFEEFFTNNEILEMNKFKEIGIIKSVVDFEPCTLKDFEEKIRQMRESGKWNKLDIVAIFNLVLPYFEHNEKGKYLDQKM
jgi:FlaA1/EpsC-like NDP-sugar epimerase